MDQDQDDFHPLNDNNMHVGFVELIEPATDLVFTYLFHSSGFPSPKPNADAVRLWAKFFAPGNSQNSVAVPKQWADFFTALLLNPSSFPWAKQFLSSPACSFLGDDLSGSLFTLPDVCPKSSAVPCLQNLKVPDHPTTLEEISLEDPAGTELTILSESPGEEKEKRKGKISSASSSPVTPLEKMKHKVTSSPGPWSKTFLAQADQEQQASMLEDPNKRRSKRVLNQKQGYKKT